MLFSFKLFVQQHCAVILNNWRYQTIDLSHLKETDRIEVSTYRMNDMLDKLREGEICQNEKIE